MKFIVNQLVLLRGLADRKLKLVVVLMFDSYLWSIQMTASQSLLLLMKTCLSSFFYYLMLIFKKCVNVSGVCKQRKQIFIVDISLHWPTLYNSRIRNIRLWKTFSISQGNSFNLLFDVRFSIVVGNPITPTQNQIFIPFSSYCIFFIWIIYYYGLKLMHYKYFISNLRISSMSKNSYKVKYSSLDIW